MPSGGNEDDWYVTGRTVDCEGGDRTVTITFDSPVVDPLIEFRFGGVGTKNTAPAPNTCYVTWNDISIEAINGTDASSYQIDQNDLPSGYADGLSAHPATYTFDNNTFSLTPYAGECFDYPTVTSTNPAVKVTGAVTSVTFTVSQMAMLQNQGSKSCILFYCTDGTFVRNWTIGSPSALVAARLPDVDLSVTKTASSTVVSGGQVEWTISVANTSSTGSHGYVVRDAVPDTVTDVSLVSAPDGCELSGRDLICTAAPDGWSIDTSDPDNPVLTGGVSSADVPVVLDANSTDTPIVLRGTATGALGSTIENTATVVGVDYDPSSENNSSTTTTTVAEPNWSVTKTATVEGGATYASPGDVVTYTVTAANSGTTDVTGAVLTDDLTDVLSSATVVPGSATLTIGSESPTTLTDPTAADPVLTAGPLTIPAGESAILTYQVTVSADTWSANLQNTVSAAGDETPGTCAVGVTPDDACQTTTRVTARLSLLKRGTVNGQVTALDGAGFELLTDDNGSIGADTGITVDALSETGTFEITDVTPGTYWLRETKAPDGHDLLATAVRFTVDDAGTVTLTDPTANTQVTASGGQIVVTDSPRFSIPATGGSGTGVFTGLGLLLLAIAAISTGVVIWRRRGAQRALERGLSDLSTDHQHRGR